VNKPRGKWWRQLDHDALVTTSPASDSADQLHAAMWPITHRSPGYPYDSHPRASTFLTPATVLHSPAGCRPPRGGRSREQRGHQAAGAPSPAPEGKGVGISVVARLSPEVAPIVMGVQLGNTCKQAVVHNTGFLSGQNGDPLPALDNCSQVVTFPKRCPHSITVPAAPPASLYPPACIHRYHITLAWTPAALAHECIVHCAIASLLPSHAAIYTSRLPTAENPTAFTSCHIPPLRCHVRLRTRLALRINYTTPPVQPKEPDNKHAVPAQAGQT
jgi:hypothetical protein